MKPASDDAWQVVEGNLNSVKTQIRYRQELELSEYQGKYPKLLTIIWEYEANDIDNSLPYSDDLESMQSFEITLTDNFESKGVGTLTFVYTADGQREFGFYISDLDQVGEVINSTLEPGLPINISVNDDEDWKEFKGILDLVS